MSELQTEKPVLTKTKILQKRFAREYLDNGCNGARAVQKVKPGISSKYATEIASKLTRNSNVIKEIYRLCESQGLLPESAIGTLAETLNADRPLQGNDGSIVANWPDHAIRLKAAESALRLFRLLPGSYDGSGRARGSGPLIAMDLRGNTAGERIINAYATDKRESRKARRMKEIQKRAEEMGVIESQENPK